MSSRAKKFRQRPTWVQDYELSTYEELCSDPIYDDILEQWNEEFKRNPNVVMAYDSYEMLWEEECKTLEAFVTAICDEGYELGSDWEGYNPMDV